MEWSETKNIKWKTEIPGLGAATPVVWGDRIFLLTAVPLGVSDDEVHQYRGALPERDVHQYLVLAIDRRDGRIVWERVAGERQPHEATHASSGTYASSSAITDSGAIVWSHGRDTPYVSSPLLYDDALYFTKYVHGILSVFDAKAGTAHCGPQRMEGVRNIMASPVAADGRVYITGRDGTTIVIRHGKAYEVLATNKLDDQFSASMVLVGSEIYMRGDTYLYAIAEN